MTTTEPRTMPLWQGALIALTMILGVIGVMQVLNTKDSPATTDVKTYLYILDTMDGVEDLPEGKYALNTMCQAYNINPQDVWTTMTSFHGDNRTYAGFVMAMDQRCTPAGYFR